MGKIQKKFKAIEDLEIGLIQCLNFYGVDVDNITNIECHEDRMSFRSGNDEYFILIWKV